MLQDQIVEKVHNGRIQERLLLEADLTLDKATQIANQLESAMANASEFVKPAELSVQRLHMRKKEANTRKGTQLKQQSRMRVQPECRCYRCDSSSHLANSKQCPALNKSCGKI